VPSDRLARLAYAVGIDGKKITSVATASSATAIGRCELIASRSSWNAAASPPMRIG
jgi:hypothetical protein